MAKPKPKSNKRNTLNNHSSKRVHSEKRKDGRQVSAFFNSKLLKIGNWLYFAYKIDCVVEFLLNYLQIGI